MENDTSRIRCNSACELKGDYVYPTSTKSNILFLIDYPSGGDKNSTILSSVDQRAQAFFEALSLARVDTDEIVIAPALRCIIKSKDIRKSFISHCVEDLLSQLDVTHILCFGVSLFCTVTGLPIKSIDEYRMQYVQTEVSGKTYTVSCTYSLSLMDSRGCSACSRGSYVVLMAKDMKMLMKEAKNGSNKRK